MVHKFILVLTFILGVRCRTGSYPPIVNVGKFVPVSLTPENTCGTGKREMFCIPGKEKEDLENHACEEASCDQECPGRDRGIEGPPKYISLLSTSENSRGPCVQLDHRDTRGTSSPSFVFKLDPLCFMQPPKMPRIGSRDSQFTLAVWLKQNPRNVGVIFEKIVKIGANNHVILSVLVGSFSIIVQYMDSNGKSRFKAIPASFPADEWHHLALQVHDRSASVFIDGLGADGTATATVMLDAPMADSNRVAFVKIGQRLRGTGQYVGKMRNMQWFERMLTNREIQELVTGQFKELNIQSHCLCPDGTPRIHPTDQRYCIPNGHNENTPASKLRLNPNSHPLEYINDGDYSTTWISGKVYMPGGVTITIDLSEKGQFEIFRIQLQFYHPQARTIAFSRLSENTGDRFESWGNYADNCYLRYRLTDNAPLTSPTDVNCLSFPDESEIPYHGNNITFHLLPPAPLSRPGSDAFYDTPGLREFTLASKVRFRMRFQYYTEDKSVNAMHQLYSLHEVMVIGRCDCFGHADDCDVSVAPYQCDCVKESFTEGTNCQRCQPLYNNKPFMRGTNSTAYDCQPCECNKHADSCHYDETVDEFPQDFFRGGGGVCDNCKHNTAGKFCEMCATFYYREEGKALDDLRVCSKCNCHRDGVFNGTLDCEKINGQCSCKPQAIGRQCDTCADGFFNLNIDNPDGCESCECHLPGTVNRNFTCQQVGGQCLCKQNVRGRTCSECDFGFKNLDDSNELGCEPCACNELGAQNQYCNSITGNCFCKDNVKGMHCDMCEGGFWNLGADGCIPCGCDEAGTLPGTICDKVSGQCKCKANTQGRTCNECVDGYFNLSKDNRQGCENCNCDLRGTVDMSFVCDKVSGQCSCKPKVEGRICNLCKGNTFGLRTELTDGCEPCNCDPRGTQLGDELESAELVCDSNTGQCSCLSSRESRRCDVCSSGFYLPPDDSHGCFPCNCHAVGSINNVCHNTTGQCPCKEDEGLTSRRCDQCADLFYDFHPLFGSCKACGCDVRGSESLICDVDLGQCPCKKNVQGRTCNECKEGSSRLVESNPSGCYSHPEQQAAPEVENITTSWVFLSWKPPDHPNGDELYYVLYQNGKIVFERNESMPFKMNFYNATELLPYANYDFYLVTSNVGGSVNSPEIRVQTLAGIPTAIPPLQVKDITAHTAYFEWEEPSVAHGPIETYVLQSLDEIDNYQVEEHYSGLDTSVTLENLAAFTNYTFILRACTSGGCGNSLPVTVITPEAKPEDLKAPLVTPLTNTSVFVSWSPPELPNGIIIQYELMMRGKPKEDGTHFPLQKVVYRTFGSYNPRPQPPGAYSPENPPETNFTMENLQPFTEYEFLISAANGLGSVESSWTTMRTLEGTPIFMNTPKVIPISSSNINVTWITPHLVTEVRGKIVMFEVIVTVNNSGNEFAPEFEDKTVYYAKPDETHFIATSFDPFTKQTFSLKVCNSISCIQSGYASTVTLPSAPEAQRPPNQVERSENLIGLQWEDPEKINGPRPQFALLKSPVSFSKPPIEMQRGIRFPGDSYVKFSSDIFPVDSTYTGIQFSFRTHLSDALLLFAASPTAFQRRDEYLVLQLRNGKPWFLFDPQDSPIALTVTSNDGVMKFNDGEWHRIEVTRFDADCFIEIDGLYTGSASLMTESTVFGRTTGIYLGGLPIDFELGRPRDTGNGVVVQHGFSGCMRDFAVLQDGGLGAWTNISFTDTEFVHRAYPLWQGCPSELDQPAAHFLGRGHVMLKDAIGVVETSAWHFEMQIRVAFPTGILFYASSDKDEFLLFSLNNTTLRLIAGLEAENIIDYSVDVGNFSSINLCDGDWHKIEVRNIQRRLSMVVDNQVDTGPYVTTWKNKLSLFQPTYFGGVDEDVIRNNPLLFSYFGETLNGYGGCMSEIYFNGKEISFARDIKKAYNTDLDGCPMGGNNFNHADAMVSGDDESSGDGSGSLLDFYERNFFENEDFIHEISTRTFRQRKEIKSCAEPFSHTLYGGNEFSFNDTEVDIFERFLYRVVSSNDGGNSNSTWQVMRSGESKPGIVGTPYNEVNISGHTIQVEWKQPLQTNGYITNYTLLAKIKSEHAANDTNSEDTNATVVETYFSGDVYKGNITGLKPWTEYFISMIACTIVGCTKSPGSLYVVTHQESPHGVHVPQADVTSESMIVWWNEPDQPNGVITEYRLYHNSSIVYSGLNTSHTIEGLKVFEAQRFKLEACTVVGCSSSDEVVLYSAQLPPSHVDQPMLTVLGPHEIEVRWLEPAILNGILHRYVIYLSTNSSEMPGDVVYNSTEFYQDTILKDLIAGTNYLVTLSACTAGGCTLSTATPTETVESSPEQIPAPKVISRSPYSVDVTWKEPLLPNGDIISYTLFQNNEFVLNSTKPSSKHIDMLYPWSEHKFRVEVCTAKGCSFSPLVKKRTLESTPIGDINLHVSVIDSHNIHVKWNEPIQPNGRVTYHVLCKGLYYKNASNGDFTTVKESRVRYSGMEFDEWVTVGNFIPYSDYVIQVNASNGAGFLMSNMKTATLPPGAPDGIMVPHLIALSPYAILSSWTDPARNNAPGSSMFQLEYRPVSPPENEMVAFLSPTRNMSFTLSNLKPYKEYEFQVTASNLYGSTKSGWVSIYTKQATPIDLGKPNVIVIDSKSLHVTWKQPRLTNGIIQNFTIMENNDVKVSTLGNVTEYRFQNLTPFTEYEYTVTACNSAGCLTSDKSMKAVTSASAPEGLSPVELRSDIPTAVHISWKKPKTPNGVLEYYILERRDNGSTAGDTDSDKSPVHLGRFVPFQALHYLDEDLEIQPFTAYQYRIIASTLGGGTTSTPWSTVITRAGRPAIINMPKVTVTGPESCYVTWEEPRKSNGPIVRYEIIFPLPRIILEQPIENLTLNVTDLVPYTDYEVTVAACTEGGCTESPSVSIKTLPSIPELLSAPIATPISENYVSIQWKPPDRPNGPGIYYELGRKIIAQPLVIPTPPFVGVTTTIYTGTELSFEDRDLVKFTEVEYRLSVFNSEGSLASNSTSVKTLGSIPLSAVEINVTVVNHTAVQIMWEAPTVFELQGEVHFYMIIYESGEYGKNNVSIKRNETHTILNNLEPGTLYSFKLRTSNGAHTVDSEEVTATTEDGAPDGVSIPVIYALSASELRVSWLEPEKPNGKILQYNILVDDRTIYTGLSQPSSFVVKDLIPFTIYEVKLQACTEYACAESEPTQSTTQETKPRNLSQPITKVIYEVDKNGCGVNYSPNWSYSFIKKVVISPTAIDITWQPPKFPNGILISYKLERRAMLSCVELNMTQNPYYIEKKNRKKPCNYVTCSLGEELCGETCYKPDEQVCCEYSLYPRNNNYECCNENYLPQKNLQHDVCCGGKFHSHKSDHKCCGRRYIQVFDEETCCQDYTEDRVTVGAGDACCGPVPYQAEGLQICCGGLLHDAYNKKCCGGNVIENHEICCGDENSGKSYEYKNFYECCGRDYLPVNTTICCKDENSNHEKAHIFADELTVLSSNKKCCGKEVISINETCCNGVGFNSKVQVCADVATSTNDVDRGIVRCGTGVLCPVSRTQTAFCDRCDFNFGFAECMISTYVPVIHYTESDICPTMFTTIYEGPTKVLSFADSNTTPYTKYEYKVSATNSAGKVTSDVTTVTTFQSFPEDVYAPDWFSDNQENIVLTWKPPGRLNGIITRYILMRNGLEIWSGKALKHTDDFDIKPYEEYEYVLKACTYIDCTSSSSVYATSVQGVPDPVNAPVLRVLSSESILISWTPPPKSNGLIQNYFLNETHVGTIHTVPSSPVRQDSFQYEHDGLEAYTEHTYTITACTSAGCSISEESIATTDESAPTGVWLNPKVLILNSTTIEVYWSAPKKENGIIREYRLLRQIKAINGIPRRSGALNLIYAGPPSVFKYTDSELIAGGYYAYKLVAINKAGFGTSELHDVEMPQVVPEETPSLKLRVLGSTSLRVDWEFLSAEEIDASGYVYSIIVQKEEDPKIKHQRSRRNVEEKEEAEEEEDNDMLLVYAAGSNQTYVVEKLQPYTLYRVRLKTCIASNTSEFEPKDCVVSDQSAKAKTLPTAPEDIEAPELKAISPNEIEITWKPPKKPNGIITQYQIFRRNTPKANSESNPPEKLIYFTGDLEKLWYTDSDEILSPYTTYDYRVSVRNAQGAEDSEWKTITTLPDVPKGIKNPQVLPLSAFAVQAKWLPPEKPNGDIVSYSLEYQEDSNDPTREMQIIKAVTVPPTVHHASFSGLEAYKTYNVRLVVVNVAKLEGRSEWVSVTTSPAPPSDVGNFTVVKLDGGESLLLTWSPPKKPNGQINIYKIYEAGFEDPIYRGLARQYLVRRLTPFTNYTFILEVCTGLELCTLSPLQQFQTAETIPETQTPPIVSFANATAITVTWIEPPRPNGEIIHYMVLRKKFTGSTNYQSTNNQLSRRKRYIDLSQAQSFAFPYEYWSLVNEDDDSFSTMKMKRMSKRSVDEFQNQNMKVVYKVDRPKNKTYTYTDADLEPFSKYGYKIRTSTNAGYTDSEWSMAETHQAAPQGLDPPIIIHTTDRSPHSLIVRWNLPEKNNGILQTFQIFRNDSTPLSFPVTQFQFEDTDLKPYTVYTYTVKACTGGGCTSSPPNSMRTLEEAPLFVAAPTAITLNSTAIQVSWSPPTIANGVIKTYKVKVDDTIRYDGENTMVVLDGLQAYKLYSVVLVACTRSGCKDSEVTSVRTMEAFPQFLDAPEIHVTSPNSMEVTWSPPMSPNGEIIRYELRRNNVLVYTNNGQLTRYHDFNLEPGTEYSYILIAYNNMGSVQSPANTDLTDPSAPSGLSPPLLTAVSSSSILAEWDPPAKPNGVIVNYTLHVRHLSNRDDEKIQNFPGNVYSFTVRGLKFYEEYAFWLKTCTLLGCIMSERAIKQTLEGPPTDQLSPTVFLLYPDDISLTISWNPPLKPNGMISHYNLFRRRILVTPSSIETMQEELAYNASGTSYIDNNVLAYTQYQYKVEAVNNVGKAPSKWSEPTRTGEAAPGPLSPPTFGVIETRSIQVFASEPLIPNGIIRSYHIYLRENSSTPFEKVTSGLGTEQTIVQLHPYQKYEIQFSACTLEHLCTRSSSAFATTLPAPPRGQSPPQITYIAPTNISIAWSMPFETNGNIHSFEVEIRDSCPLPHQPIEQHCVPSQPNVAFVGLSNNANIQSLQPYKSYDVRVTSFNQHGAAQSEWARVVTHKKEPAYVMPFMVSSNISSIMIMWRQTFKLNSVLVRYELTDDNDLKYAGLQSQFRIRKTALQVHKFKITVTTDTGSAVTPTLIYDTIAGKEMLVPSDQIDSAKQDETKPPPTINTAGVPVYKSMWFAVLMSLLGMIIFFSVMAVALRRNESKTTKPLEKRIPLGLRNSNNLSPRSDINFDLNQDFHGDGSLLNYSVRSLTVPSRIHDSTKMNFNETSRQNISRRSNRSYLTSLDGDMGRQMDDSIFSRGNDDVRYESFYPNKEHMSSFVDTHL